MEYLIKVDDRALLSFLCNQLAILNDDSESLDVAGIVFVFFANSDNLDNVVSFCLQNSSQLSF